MPILVTDSTQQYPFEHSNQVGLGSPVKRQEGQRGKEGG